MSYAKAAKANQNVHRERSQLSARTHLGMLEKKKDYKQRAQDYQKKQKTLKALKRRAEERNPDEFYFKMIKTKLEDGEHQSEDTTPQYTPEQLKLMSSQDVKYLNYKRSTEMKKIERMKSSLHMLDAPDKQKNKHIVFLDSKMEVKEFDAAKHFETDATQLGCVYNRLRTADKAGPAIPRVDAETRANLVKETAKKYKELQRRQEREKQIRITVEKMNMKDALRDTKSKKVKVMEETVNSAAQYKWAPCRKR